MSKWVLYIPDDGHWDIPNYRGNSVAIARWHARQMLRIKRLPNGSTVSLNPDWKLS